jgi:hypothetical protein
MLNHQRLPSSGIPRYKKERKTEEQLAKIYAE